MDDIITEIKVSEIDQKLEEINSYHPSLKFTIERENNKSLPFLDMKVVRTVDKLSSTWYTKPKDTGLTMNFHTTAPIQYKRSVVTGFVHQIHNACSSWKQFQESLLKAKTVLENNQYPPHFYEPLIKKAIDKIMKKDDNDESAEENAEEDEQPEEKKFVRIEYRGKLLKNLRRP